MKEIITCQNLSHREKLILSFIFILLPIIFDSNFAKSHEKKLHQIFINELIQSECDNRKNISYELLKMREKNISFAEAKRFINNSDFARKKEIPSAEILALIDKFYDDSSVILDKYKNLSKEELSEKLFLECFEIRGNHYRNFVNWCHPPNSSKILVDCGPVN